MRPANRESYIIASFHLYDTNDKNNYGVVAAMIKWGHFFYQKHDYEKDKAPVHLRALGAVKFVVLQSIYDTRRHIVFNFYYTC